MSSALFAEKSVAQSLSSARRGSKPRAQSLSSVFRGSKPRAQSLSSVFRGSGGGAQSLSSMFRGSNPRAQSLSSTFSSPSSYTRILVFLYSCFLVYYTFIYIYAREGLSAWPGGTRVRRGVRGRPPWVRWFLLWSRGVGVAPTSRCDFALTV